MPRPVRVVGQVQVKKPRSRADRLSLIALVGAK